MEVCNIYHGKSFKDPGERLYSTSEHILKVREIVKNLINTSTSGGFIEAREAYFWYKPETEEWFEIRNQ